MDQTAVSALTPLALASSILYSSPVAASSVIESVKKCSGNESVRDNPGRDTQCRPQHLDPLALYAPRGRRQLVFSLHHRVMEAETSSRPRVRFGGCAVDDY